MNAMGLYHNVKVTKVQDHTAAGTSTVTSDSVDLAGYEGVTFLTSFGTAASGNILKAGQSSDDSSYADLVGTGVTSGSSDEDVMLEIYRPEKRYLKAYAVRGTSSTCESIWAFRWGAKDKPVTNIVSGTFAAEFHNRPAEGTA